MSSGGAYIGGATPGLNLPGTGANYASTPNAAPIQIGTDIDIRWRCMMPDWTPSHFMDFVTKYPAGFAIGTDASGTLQFYGGGAASSALGFVDGSTWSLRMALTQSTKSISWYKSSDVDLSTATWTLINTVTDSIGNAAGGAELQIGRQSDDSTNASLFAGRMERVQIRNGINGTIVFDADFTAQPPGTQTFVESSANAATVTIHSSDSTSFGYYFTTAAGDLNVAANWSVGVIPGSTSTAIINGSTAKPGSNSGLVAIGGLTLSNMSSGDNFVPFKTLQVIGNVSMTTMGGATVELALVKGTLTTDVTENQVIIDTIGSGTLIIAAWQDGSEINGSHGGTVEFQSDTSAVIGAGFTSGTLIADVGHSIDLNGSVLSRSVVLAGAGTFTDYTVAPPSPQSKLNLSLGIGL